MSDPHGPLHGAGAGVQLSSLPLTQPAESSPLLAFPHTSNGGYDGSLLASRWPAGGGDDAPAADGEQHRCRRSYGPRPLVVASVAIGAGSFAQGYDGTAVGFLLTNSFGGFIPMGSWQTGWVVAMFFLGGVIGAYVSSWMNDALGRRVPLLAAGALCTVAALLGMTTDRFWWLLCVRCLFGIGMGINNASLAIYYAEITPKAERGGVVAMTEVFFAVGGIVACVTQLCLQGWLTTREWERNNWRLLMGAEALPGLVMFLGALKCAESPHWLLRAGAATEAERVLHRIYQPTRLAGGGCDCVERNADLADALDALARSVEARAFRTPKRTRGILDAMRHSAKKLAATLALLRSPVKRIRRALELNLVMATMPFIGIGCIPQQFVPMLLEMGVATGRHRRYDTAISRETLLIDLSCNVVYVIGSLLTCVLLVDKIGRRTPLCICLAGSTLGFALDSYTQAAPVVPRDAAAKRVTLVIALTGVMLGYICRAMGVGPLHQVIGSEVVPLEIAARGKAIYAMARRASAMLFCLFFPPLLEALGGERMFAGLSLLTLVYFLAVLLRLPETKGYEVSEIETILDGHEWIPWAAVPPPARPPGYSASRGALVPPLLGEGLARPRPAEPLDAREALRPRPARPTAKGRLASSASFVVATPDLGA